MSENTLLLLARLRTVEEERDEAKEAALEAFRAERIARNELRGKMDRVREQRDALAGSVCHLLDHLHDRIEQHVASEMQPPVFLGMDEVLAALARIRAKGPEPGPTREELADALEHLTRVYMLGAPLGDHGVRAVNVLAQLGRTVGG